MEDREVINKAFNSVVNELGYNKSENTFLDSIIEGLASLGTLFKILFVLALVLIIIFITYRVFRFIRKSDKKFIIKSSECSEETRDDTLSRLEELKRSGKYNEALLLLHKLTLIFLRERGFIQFNRDYTNREINKIINREKYLNSFNRIAIKTQGVLFNRESVDMDEYLYLEKIYREEFQ